MAAEKFIGKPCRHHGPNIDRYVASGGCVLCAAVKDARRHEAEKAARAANPRRRKPKAPSQRRRDLEQRKLVNMRKVLEFRRLLDDGKPLRHHISGLTMQLANEESLARSKWLNDALRKAADERLNELRAMTYAQED